jgi:type 1 fimbria pilin
MRFNQVIQNACYCDFIHLLSTFRHISMKYISISNLSAVAALLMTAGSALAAGPTATLQVKGTITPAACTPVLANGGIVDFGATSTSEFTSGSKLMLTGKNVSLNVTCTAPTKVSFSVTDNREDSVVDVGGASAMGMGRTTDNKKIGDYLIEINTVLADDVAADAITSADKITWAKFYDTSRLDKLSSGGSDSNVSVAAAGTVVPVAFENMSMNLKITPFLNSEMSSVTEVQQLDGNATLNFEYL